MDILIADDQGGVRSALRLLLGEHPGCNIVAEAEDTASLLEKVAQTQPGLVLLDAELTGLPGKGGEQNPEALGDLLSRLRGCCDETKVVVLSSRPDVRTRALFCGADAFISKSDPPESLLKIIDQLCSQNDRE